MNSGALCSIGELARRTGLTVKTIRFYSDRGIVAPAVRSAAGHRRYGTDAVARLHLVRTLRDLGLGLATIRKVADQELTLAEVARRLPRRLLRRPARGPGIRGDHPFPDARAARQPRCRADRGLGPAGAAVEGRHVPCSSSAAGRRILRRAGQQYSGAAP